MQFNMTLPFELGETYKGTEADGTTIVTPEWAGQVFMLPDSNIAASRVNPRRTGRQLLAIPVLNNSGITLLGRRLVRFKRAGGYNDLSRVDGYATVLNDKNLCVVDEYLATTGVADKYYFWGIVRGPVTLLTPTVDTNFNGDIAVNAPLVAATGATSGNSTSGRVSNVTLTNATAGGTTVGFDAFNMAHWVVGRALSARTTAETAATILVNLTLHY